MTAQNWEHSSDSNVVHLTNPHDIEGFFDPKKLFYKQETVWEADPILDPTVPRLGATTLVGLRSTGNAEYDTLREHRFYTVELDGYRQAIEVTDPIDGEPSYVITSKPGFTEHIEGGIRKKLHEELAATFPSARIVSIASDGIGTTGGRFDWSERHEHGLKEMGTKRLALARALAGDLEVYDMGTSMGTVIGHRTAETHLAGNYAHKPVNLKGQFWISPAVVDPRYSVEHMGLRFVPELALDLGKELVFKTGPMRMAKLIGTACCNNFRTEDMTALSHQLLELLPGTQTERVIDVIREIPTVVVTGGTDVLSQLEMFDAIKGQVGENLDVHVVANRGHGLVIKPERLCYKLGQAVHAMLGEEPPQKSHKPTSQPALSVVTS
jgi:hypothetical protein